MLLGDCISYAQCHEKNDPPPHFLTLSQTLARLNSKYIPYWASRNEFNQIELSERMISDHAAQRLPDIIGNIRLDDFDDIPFTEVHTTFQMKRSSAIEVSVDESRTRRVFVCFSTPNGRRSFILAFGVTLALILSFVVGNSCDFFTRKAVVSDSGSSYEEPSLNIGLYYYELKKSKNSTYEDSGLCTPFPPAFEPGAYMLASRSFAFFAMVFGSLSFMIAWTSTSLTLKKRGWYGLIFCTVATTACQGLVFLVLRTDLCTTSRNPIEELIPDSTTCILSRAGIFSILATCLWFLNSVGSWHMARITIIK